MKVAGALFKKIKANQPHLFDKDHGNIKFFDVFAIVPKFRSLGKFFFDKIVHTINLFCRPSNC